MDVEEFANTLDDFASSVPDLLLFTRSVRQISVYVKDSAAAPARLLHESSATIEQMPQPNSEGVVLQKLTITTQPANGRSTKKVWSRAVSTAEHAFGAGIAMLLQSDGFVGQRLPELAGRVFCTMILSFQQTGLPVHINGAFRMSSDRRKLWEGEGDRGQVTFLLSTASERH